METAIITFLNGMEITTEVNGTCFIVNNKPDFPEDLSFVSILNGENVTELQNVKIQECASVDGRYWFTFIQISEIESRFAEIEDALCELSMMEG